MNRFLSNSLLLALIWAVVWALAGCSNAPTTSTSTTAPAQPPASAAASPATGTQSQSSSAPLPTTPTSPAATESTAVDASSVAPAGASSPAVSQTQSSRAESPTQSSSAPAIFTPPVVSEPPAVADSSSVPAAPPTDATAQEPTPSTEKEENSMVGLTIQVGDEQFTATLADNAAARAFALYLPMTVQMAELNGQEKLYNLPKNLSDIPTERPSTIHRGEIMCWSGNTLVLFYSTFSNSYGGYQRLGTVDHPEGLARALGEGAVEVTWSLTA